VYRKSPNLHHERYFDRQSSGALIGIYANSEVKPKEEVNREVAKYLKIKWGKLNATDLYLVLANT
jgi:hypothetical protein